MRIRWSSSFRQDRFAWEISRRKLIGTFLDMGSGPARDTSNTYALERAGWTGWLCDVTNYTQEYAGIRTSPFYHMDGAAFPMGQLPDFVDFLSFDVDGSWHPVAEHILFGRTRFGAITIEHDSYAGGYSNDSDPRTKQRNMLTELGYFLVCGNVRCDLGQIEDWWCDLSIINGLKCEDKMFSEIVPGDEPEF